MKQNVKYIEKLTLRWLLLSARISLYFGDFHPSTSHFFPLGNTSNIFYILPLTTSSVLSAFPIALLFPGSQRNCHDGRI